MDIDVNHIIGSLKTLYTKLQQKLPQEHKESQTYFEPPRQFSILCILPRKILRKIFLHLEFIEEIPNILLTCKLFNSIIKSRTFQVLLHSQSTINSSKLYTNVIISSNTEIENIKLKPEQEITTKEDALAQLKLANSGRDFLVTKIKKQDKKIEELNKEIQRLQEEIKLQKNIHSKGIEKMNAFETLFENEKKTLSDAQKTLSSLQTSYKIEIDALKNQIANSDKNRLDLLDEKKNLKEEVLKLRQNNLFMTKKIAVYQNVLNKMKAYFEAMEEADLLHSI
jgi:F-box domain